MGPPQWWAQMCSLGSLGLVASFVWHPVVSNTMSVRPQLLVCLPMGATAWCMAGASWLAGLTGVGCLIMAACWASLSVDGLQSKVLRLGWALFMLTPFRTCDTMDLTDFLSTVLKRVDLIPVCLWFHVGYQDWWNSLLGLPVGGKKLCSLYNNKYWTANMFYSDAGTLEAFNLLCTCQLTKLFKGPVWAIDNPSVRILTRYYTIADTWFLQLCLNRPGMQVKCEQLGVCAAVIISP